MTVTQCVARYSTTTVRIRMIIINPKTLYLTSGSAIRKHFKEG